MKQTRPTDRSGRRRASTDYERPQVTTLDGQDLVEALGPALALYGNPSGCENPDDCGIAP